ncbi:dual specificity protein kinase pyk3 [Anaeramoeba flamelloides]|uniref:Dual specificity protein kinase pyk3 n=1 Tax=Anaeramoeba flamelloides TaxID=1746091 RepID=A0AAV7YV47_9EUKA|nr:dual specificity protein kinase pyk3 [Anaeramoeba flamelloides]
MNRYEELAGYCEYPGSMEYPKTPVLQICKNNVQRNRNDKESLFQLAVCEARTKLYSNSINTFLKLITLYPQEFKAYQYLGFTYTKNSQNESAIMQFRRALQIKTNRRIKNVIECLVELHKLLMKLNRFQESLQELEGFQNYKTIRADSKIQICIARSLYFNGEKSKSINKYKDIITDSQNLIYARIELSKILNLDWVKKGKPKSVRHLTVCLGLAKRLYSHEPRLKYEILLNRSFSYEVLGKLSEAIADAKACSQLEPKKSEPWLRLGRIERANFNNSAAIKYFEKGSKHLKPNNPEYHKWLECYTKTLIDEGEFTMAERIIGKLKVIRLSNNLQAKLFLIIARLYKQIPDKIQNAIRFYSRVMHLKPNNSFSLIESGYCFIKIKKFRNAKKNFELVLKQKKNHPMALLGFAFILTNNNDKNTTKHRRKILDYIKTANQNLKNNQTHQKNKDKILYLSSKLYLILGDINTSSIYLKNALKISPCNSKYLIKMSKIHIGKKEYSDAKKNLKIILKEKFYTKKHKAKAQKILNELTMILIKQRKKNSQQERNKNQPHTLKKGNSKILSNPNTTLLNNKKHRNKKTNFNNEGRKKNFDEIFQNEQQTVMKKRRLNEPNNQQNKSNAYIKSTITDNESSFLIKNQNLVKHIEKLTKEHTQFEIESKNKNIFIKKLELEINNLKNNNKHLFSQNGKNEKTITQMKNEIKEKVQIIDQLKFGKDGNDSLYRIQIQQLRAKIDQNEKIINKFIDENEMLKNNLTDFKIKNEKSMNKEINEKEKMIKVLKKENFHFKDEKKENEKINVKKINEKDKIIDEKDKIINELKNEIHQLKNENHQSEDQLYQLKNEKKENEKINLKKINEKDKIINEKDRIINELKNKNYLIKKTNEKKNNENIQIIKKLKEQNENEKQNNIKNKKFINQKANENERIINELKNENHQLKNEKKENEKINLKKINEKDKTINDKDKIINELKNINNQIKKTNEKKNNENIQLIQKLKEQTENEKQNNIKNKQFINQKINEKEKNIKELKNEIHQLTNENYQLQKENHQLQNEKKKNQKRIPSLGNDKDKIINEKDKIIKELNDENDLLKENLQQKNNENTQFFQKVNESNQTIKDLKHENNLLKANYKDTNSQYIMLIKKFKEQSEKVQEYINEKKQFNIILEEKNNIINLFKKKGDALKADQFVEKNIKKDKIIKELKDENDLLKENLKEKNNENTQFFQKNTKNQQIIQQMSNRNNLFQRKIHTQSNKINYLKLLLQRIHQINNKGSEKENNQKSKQIINQKINEKEKIINELKNENHQLKNENNQLKNEKKENKKIVVKKINEINTIFNNLKNENELRKKANEKKNNENIQTIKELKEQNEKQKEINLKNKQFIIHMVTEKEKIINELKKENCQLKYEKKENEKKENEKINVKKIKEKDKIIKNLKNEIDQLKKLISQWKCDKQQTTPRLKKNTVNLNLFNKNVECNSETVNDMEIGNGSRIENKNTAGGGNGKEKERNKGKENITKKNYQTQNITPHKLIYIDSEEDISDEYILPIKLEKLGVKNNNFGNITNSPLNFKMKNYKPQTHSKSGNNPVVVQQRVENFYKKINNGFLKKEH